MKKPPKRRKGPPSKKPPKTRKRPIKKPPKTRKRPSKKNPHAAHVQKATYGAQIANAAAKSNRYSVTYRC